MQRRQLARDGVSISAVGLGCMSFGGFYGPTDQATSLATLGAALDHGVDFWDTADVYGMGLSETIIGTFFAQNPGSRERVTLGTKFSIRRMPDGARAFDNSAEYMATALEASLKRLGTDHVDLYYVHRIDARIPIEDTIGALARHVESGKIRAIGISEMAPDTLRRAASVHPIAAIQSEYSLWTRGAEGGLLQACEEVGATLVAFSPVARAYLAGVLQDVETFAKGDFRADNPRFQGLNWRRNRDRLGSYLDYARSLGVAPTTLAIAWTLAKSPRIVPIPGTRTAAHLKECADGAALALTKGQIDELERILPIGFAAGDRYPASHWVGIEKY
jgi:aryl-alcohol dehydrogenase-like predicted oxidoreductase